MAVPGFKAFLRPVLEVVSEQVTVKSPRRTLVPFVKEKMKLSDEDVLETLNSGGNRLRNRVGWALTYLKKAGLVSSPKRGVAEITKIGSTFLETHTGDISPKDLTQFESFLEFKKGNKAIEESTVSDLSSLDELDPEEKINIGYTEIEASIIDELLEKLLEFNPAQFEEFVLDLIRSLGYGKQVGKIVHTGGSGDFGIDGIVHLDRLGLDKIYLQAKRYKLDSKISSSDIQKFYGALSGFRATKGVFLTTSSYQDSALKYAASVSDTLVLLDGKQIAKLMVEYKVGVAAKRVISIPEIDTDYFEN